MIPHCDPQDASLISRDRTDEILKSIMFPIYFCAIWIRCKGYLRGNSYNNGICMPPLLEKKKMGRGVITVFTRLEAGY